MKANPAVATSDEHPPPDGMVGRRCQDEDADGGRCQLVRNHPGSHAAAADGAYLTWSDGEVHRWAAFRPPHWLVFLPWMPDAQPPVTHDDNLPPTVAAG